MSLSAEAVGFCEAGEKPLLEPEALTACLAGPLPSVASSVKQPDPLDSSSAPSTASSAAVAQEAPLVVVSLVADGSPTSIARRYQMDDNHDVRRFLDQFQTGYRRAVVERWLVRAGRYLPMVLDVFKQKGLPEELVFTAMIESGFDPVAVSRAGAKGLWQFMAPTARRYGLRIDKWLDERLDPEKSTMAAARHFLDLYAVFGSWNLVQAAYNAGERTVLEAIRGMGTSDFWALSRGRWLKDETKNFIPAIQAATIIAREPERYGFVVTPAAPLSYELAVVPKSTSLKQLAGKTGIPLETLERLNTELRLGQTPPDGPYGLKVPAGGAAIIRAALERDMPTRHVAASKVSDDHVAVRNVTATRRAIHVVKRQETVAGIAKRYGVSASDIVRWNDLDGTARIFPGKRLRVASLGNREEAQGGFR
ncbi:MAG TPA: transglycosylase SLT domain-containing protein [Methylomirabilota bacterium]|nr:transglycosylase SLT domain-containing protein [Methylomirabilota bacterium]